MKITKIYNVESAHIVRNCTSERCSHSIHGHSAKIEVSFSANSLDNAQMVMDFGLMKDEIKKFIDSMDHCYLLCSTDSDDFKEFIKKSCDRWIELPFNPSAEMLSLFVMDGVSRILDNMQFNNGEDRYIECCNVRYHETATGSAECDWHDLESIYDENGYFDKITYSDKIQQEWNSENLVKILVNRVDATIVNPVIPQQIKLK